MMRLIVESSLRLRLLMVTLAVMVMFLGIKQLRNMSLDGFPEFSPPYVEIQTEALGLSAAEVEQLITVPLEADLLNGVAWLQTIRSDSIPGLSSITLIFEPGTDVMRARQMVQERLSQAHALPNVSKPPTMLQPLSSANRVSTVGLSSKTLSHIDMSVLARWTIKPHLMGIPGVANVAIWGQRKRQLQVQVDPQRLRDKGLTLFQVIESTGNALWVSPLTFLNASTPGTGGWIDTPNQRLGIRHVLPITTPEDLAKVTIEGGITLGEVAEVVEGHQPLIGDVVLNDGPGLLLVIEKFPWANTVEVTKGVEAAIEALQPGLSGIEFDSEIFRPATYIETATENLAKTLIISGILLTLVFFAFLYNWRSGLIGLVAISLSLLAAVFVLHLRGVTVNMMVLAGLVIALGAVIDDAIIDIENIVRRLREHRKAGGDKSTTSIILEASLEMRSAIAYATLIIILVVVPFLFMKDLSGAFLQPLAMSYVLALIASMIVALFVTPALAMLLFSKTSSEGRESPLVRLLQGLYDTVLSGSVRTGRLALIAVGAVGVLLVVGLALYPRLGQESLVPSLKETDLLVKWKGTPGTSITAMNRIATRATRELRSIPGVLKVNANVGRAEMSDQVVGVNSSELWVRIDPAADYDATLAAVQEVVEGYHGLDRSVLTFLKDQTREALTGADDDIVVRIYGHELEVLRSSAEMVQQALTNISGVADIQVENQNEEPTLEIEVDLAKAEFYGIKPGDVRRAASTLLAGIGVGSLFEEQKVFDVVVWGTPEIRHSLTSVNNLLIDTPGGGHVRLGEVADVRMVSAPNVIKREAAQRRLDVGLTVRGRDLGSVAADIQRLIRELSFPLEYHAEVLGEYAERQAAQYRVLSIAIAAAIGIFLLLQACFGSWRLAFVVFLTLAAALVGGVLAALLGGGILSFGSLVGFITVLGIAARNSIVLIRHYQQLEQHEGESLGAQLVQRGTRERIAPILMTAITTGLVFLPLVIFGNIPGYEILHPMAVIVLGGLVTSTLLTLLVIPALYLDFGGSPEEILAEEAFV